MLSDRLSATASVGTHAVISADVPLVRDRRGRSQQVELVGTISAVDVAEGTVTLVGCQDGRRVHARLTIRLTAQATISVDGQRRVLAALPVGEKLIATGVLDGEILTSAEVHALTLPGFLGD